MKKIAFLLIITMIGISAFLYPRLPSQIPMHWNIRGEIDMYMIKNQAVYLLPLVTILMWVMFRVLPHFDPKKGKYRLFKTEWEIIQVGLIGFMAYLQVVILYISLHPQTPLLPWMFIGLGFLFILMGNYLSKIRQNYFIGIRLPWTLADEDNWNKTHRFASWCFVVAGIITLVEAYMIWNAPFVIFGSLLLSTIMPAVYSFLLFKKHPEKMKYVFISIFFVIGILVLLRGISGEDDWMCQNGQWVKHGNPTSAAPPDPCK